MYKYKGFLLIELMVAISVFSFLVLIVNKYLSNLNGIKQEVNKSIESFCFYENFYTNSKSFKRNLNQNSKKSSVSVLGINLLCESGKNTRVFSGGLIK